MRKNNISKKGVLLISNLIPHQIVLIESLLKQGITLKVIYIKNSNAYTSSSEKVQIYQKDSLTKQEIWEVVKSYSPNFLITSGWMIKDYNWIAKKAKRDLKIPVIAGSDTQWKGTFRQKVNALISPFYVREIFSHIWVSGIYQFEYARKLGFKKENILLDILSANVDLFDSVLLKTREKKYPKRILYIGRFIEVKGIDLLLKAWGSIEDKKGWELVLIGEGKLKEFYQKKKIEKVIYKGYMSQEELVKEFEESGCFILPSIDEPWALVIHEATAAGLPVICTKVCGAAPYFVLDYYNGLKVDSQSSKSLRKAIEHIIDLPSEELLKYSKRSKELAQRITPKTSLANLLQVIKA